MKKQRVKKATVMETAAEATGALVPSVVRANAQDLNRRKERKMRNSRSCN